MDRPQVADPRVGGPEGHRLARETLRLQPQGDQRLAAAVGGRDGLSRDQRLEQMKRLTHAVNYLRRCKRRVPERTRGAIGAPVRAGRRSTVASAARCAWWG